MLKSILVILSFAAVTAQAGSNTCAVVYQGEHFTGQALRILDHTQISQLADYTMSYGHHHNHYNSTSWNNRISSVVVNNNCVLKTYQYDNFGRHYDSNQRIGARERFYGPGHYSNLGYMNDLTSSLSCFCQ